MRLLNVTLVCACVVVTMAAMAQPALPAAPVGAGLTAATAPSSVNVPVTLVDLTLEGALDLAAARHPILAAITAEVAAATDMARQAGAWPNPRAVLRVESAPWTGSTLDRAEYVAGLSQPLPLGGRAAAARRVEERGRDRQVIQLEIARRRIAVKVRKSFAAALHARESLIVHEEILNIARRGVDLAQARVRTGEAMAEESARAEIEFLGAELEFYNAGSRAEVAMAALALAIGDPDLKIESIHGELERLCALPDLDEVLARLKTSPEIRLLESEVREARARTGWARSRRSLDVSLDFFHRRLEAEGLDAFDAGVSFAIPIFDRNTAGIRAAEAAAVAAEARSRSDGAILQQQVLSLHADLQRATAAASVMKDELLPRARTVLRSAEARYREGDASLADVLPIRRDWSELRVQYLSVLRAMLEAWAELAPYLPEE